MNPSTRDFSTSPVVPAATSQRRAEAAELIWGVPSTAVAVIQFIVWSRSSEGEAALVEHFTFFVSVLAALLVVATAMRWLILPRMAESGPKLLALIIGLLLSACVAVFGLCLLPSDQAATRFVIFALSLASLLQFVPVLARWRF